MIDIVSNYKVAGESNMQLDTPKMTVTVDKKLTQNINEGKIERIHIFILIILSPHISAVPIIPRYPIYNLNNLNCHIN